MYSFSTLLYNASISSLYASIATCRRTVFFAVYEMGFEGVIAMIILVTLTEHDILRRAAGLHVPLCADATAAGRPRSIFRL